MSLTAESQLVNLSSPMHTTRQDSISTQRTNSTTITRRTVSTSRTSIMSADFPVRPNPDRLSVICDELPDFSQSHAPSTPIPASILAPQWLFEQGSLTTEKTDSKSKAPQPVTRPQVLFPRGGSKRGIMKKVKGFFRKAFCIGTSSQMDT
ncbi:hypothetical protein FRC07_007423 [Ceratobasidium sp. 392]|nr:hypothetical protein FRC07_007423 [Ceratobasidium sp. 392]